MSGAWQTSDGKHLSREQVGELQKQHNAAAMRVCMSCRVTHFFSDALEAEYARCGLCKGPLLDEKRLRRRQEQAKAKRLKDLQRAARLKQHTGSNRADRRRQKALKRKGKQ